MYAVKYVTHSGRPILIIPVYIYTYSQSWSSISLYESWLRINLTNGAKFRCKRETALSHSGLFFFPLIFVEARASLYTKNYINSDCHEYPVAWYSRIFQMIGVVRCYLHYGTYARIWILVVGVTHITAIHKRTGLTILLKKNNRATQLKKIMS